MGKNERKWSDLTEQKAAVYFGGEAGRNNFERGDILAGETIIETKCAKNGKGTFINWGDSSFWKISKNFDCITWHDFREESGFNLKRYEIIKEVRPSIPNKVAHDNTLTDEVMNYIRDYHPEQAKKISELANQNKLDFIKILKSSNQKNARVFYLNARLGRCKRGYYLENPPIEDDKYKVFLTDRNGKPLKEIVYFFDSKCDYYFSFKENITSFFLTANNGQHEVDLLRIQLHWKNGFQGAQTPCFNIFYNQ